MSLFTIEDARAIASLVVRHEGDTAPLLGKEEALLHAMRRAEVDHDEALELDKARSELRAGARRLRKKLQSALDALEGTNVNLAALDPALDLSFTEPENDRDLRGLLRRAIRGVDEEIGFVTYRDRASSRAIRSHPERVRSDGLRALVAVLFDFWVRETELPFSDEFTDAEDKTPGKKVPVSPAAKLVYHVAKSVDHHYTSEHCSAAMRPR